MQNARPGQLVLATHFSPYYALVGRGRVGLSLLDVYLDDIRVAAMGAVSYGTLILDLEKPDVHLAITEMGKPKEELLGFDLAGDQATIQVLDIWLNRAGSDGEWTMLHQTLSGDEVLAARGTIPS